MSQVSTIKHINKFQVEFSNHIIFQSKMSELFTVQKIYTVLKFLTPTNIPSMITLSQKKSHVMRHSYFSFPIHIDLFHKFIKHVIKMKTNQQ